MRTGDALHCIHSDEIESGCGFTESCKFCGALQTIDDSLKLEFTVSKECRITSKLNGREVSFDFMVTANPFKIKVDTFIILSFIDISSSKRRLALERIFFHDFSNKVGSLGGFLQLIDEVDSPEKSKEYLKYAQNISNELNDEIKAQRLLLSAENNDLKINKVYSNSLNIISSVVISLTLNNSAIGKEIIIDKGSKDINFFTDQLILKRILMNMIINALEAIEAPGNITIGCELTDKSLIFYVHNSSFIPREIALQIFQRSFSTKGTNRGLGTYSMKLLAEGFLGGKVYFTSDKKLGTKFFASFPIN